MKKTKDPKYNQMSDEAVWHKGLKLLAEEIQKNGPIPVMIAELLDKLLVGTAECQDPEGIAETLRTLGIHADHADLVAALYAVVDMVRTAECSPDLFWSSDLVDEIGEDLKEGSGLATSTFAR